MTGQHTSIRARVADGLNVGFSLWLIISPWIYGFVNNSVMTRSSVLVGVIIAICSAIRITYPYRGTGPTGVSIVLGFWTAVSPEFYGFTANLAWLWTSVIVGVAVIALAIWSVRQTHPHAATSGQTRRKNAHAAAPKEKHM